MKSEQQQDQPTTLYAAYGSNLEIRQMVRRCPGATRLASGWLESFRLTFRRTADVEPHAQSRVPVGLWCLTREDEWALDVYEGVGLQVYQRAYLPVHTPDGVRTALVYYRCNRDHAPPDETYLRCIFEGYEHWGFDPETVIRALAARPQTESPLPSAPNTH